MNRRKREAKEGHSDATIAEEERRLSRLLRKLPEPEPPAELRARVMARIHAYESRPRGIRNFFQWLAPTRTAAVLACGLAGWMLLTGDLHNLLGAASRGDLSETGPGRSANWVATRSPQPRRVPAARYAIPAGALASPAGFLLGQPRPPTPVLVGQPVLPPLDRRLDRQIDHLLHNPDAFFRRFAQIRESERYLERLANRSARRGDAADVGLRVRAIRHPMAPRVSEHFLRAPVIPAAARR